MSGTFEFGKKNGIMACQTILKEIRIWAVMLVVSVALVNCTLDEPILEESQEPEYTMTVEASMGGNPQTKALGFKDDKLVATWTENDVIYVFKETNFLGFLRPAEISTDGASCKLAGKMKVAPSIGDELTLKYLAPDSYLSQDGTLAYIAAHCDHALATVTVKAVSENREITTTAARFINQQSIVKVRMFDKADPTKTLSPTNLKVQAKVITMSPSSMSPEPTVTAVLNYELTIPQATYTTNGEGVLYLALPNIPEEYESMKSCTTIYIIGTVGNDTYTYARAGYPFEDGKYYLIDVKARKRKLVDLSKIESNYTAKDGETLTNTLNGKHKISIADGATVSLWNATIDGTDYKKDKYADYAGLTCLGDATLLLEDNSTNYVKAFEEYNPGIFVPEGKTLTIKGTGALSAYANYVAAGIGGGLHKPCGNITIDGGIITAEGNYFGAGIGAGNYAPCGDITINGGFINARGSTIAAGVGSCASEGSCRSIVINGGFIFAVGGMYAAGIGAGQGHDEQNHSVCGDITINGGYIAAVGGTSSFENKYGAAGIGSGYYYSECGNILIQGGTMEVAGTHGAAGIGCGEKSYCGNITITDGVSLVAAFCGDKVEDGRRPYCIGESLNTLRMGTVTIGGVETGSVTSDAGYYVYPPIL